MPNSLIQEFKKSVAGDPIFRARGAFSPLFLLFTWQKNTNPIQTFCITRGRDTTISVNEKSYIAVATSKFQDYFEERISVGDLQGEYDKWEKNTQQLYETVTDADLSIISDDDLVSFVKNINVLLLEMVQTTLYIENVDFEKILKVTGPTFEGKLQSMWNTATEPVFVSFEQRRLKNKLDLLTLNAPGLIRKAKYMYTDYFWTETAESIDLSLRETKLTHGEKISEYEDVYRSVEQKKIDHDLWLQALDSDSRKVAQFVQLVMRMRDTRKDPLAQLQAMLAEISVVMMSRAGMNEKFAPYVILYEYMKGVSYLSSIKLDVEERENGCMYLAYPDLTYKIEKCDFRIAMKHFTETTEILCDKLTELRGQVACRGKVKGTVRVVLDAHDDKGFLVGDILVTSMTRPEFVPLMKKAGAVITNEGGITCHAAIVSRELCTPCIIGTKIATEVFKDGDMVEVDADNGVVRIIS